MLLKHKFQQVKPIYGNSLSIYSFEVKKGTIIEELRDDIWDKVFTYFEFYEKESLELLESCATMHPDNNTELMKYDLEYILKIINQKLNPKVFEHCRYVQKQIWWCKRSKVDHKSFLGLSTSFNCELFQSYKVLNRQLLKGVGRYELHDQLENEVYEEEKNNEIKAYAISKYSKNPALLYEDYKYLYKVTNAEWSISGTSFDLAVVSIFDVNFGKGLELLEIVIKDNNQINYIPYWPFSNFLVEEKQALEIFEVINKGNYNRKTNMMLSYFERLQVENLYQKTSIDIVNWSQSASENFSISFGNLEKYLKVDSKLFKKILISLNQKMKEGLRIYFYGSLFEKYLDLFHDDIKTLKETYLIQDLTENDFDYDSKGLAQLCLSYPDFLLEYFEHFYSAPELKRPNKEYRDKYSFIWSNENLIQRMEFVLDFIIDKEQYYGIGEHPAGKLFEQLNPNESQRAISFLRLYMIKHTNSPEHLTVVMDIVNKKFTDRTESFVKTHLIINKNKSVFEKVKWTYNQVVYGGNDDTDLITAKRWEEILSYVNSLPEDIMLLPIQNFINETIDRYKEYSRSTKKRRAKAK